MEALITALLYVAEKSNIRLAIDPDDGKVYEIGEEGKELTRLHPIADPSQTVVEYDTERLVTLHNATALQRYCNGYLTEWQRLAIGRETALQRAAIGMTTDEQRIVNGFATDAERELIGAGKVNLPPFSTSCPPEVEGVARKIEQLLRRAISNTNKPATLETLMQYHRDAAKYAAAGNVFKLNQIEARLRGVVAKQGAIKTSEQTLARRRRRRMVFFKVIIAVVIFTTGALCIYNAIKPRPSPQSDVATTERAASPTPPPSALAAAFDEWERETGRRIYPAGRDCIERAAAAAGVTDNKEAIKKIIYKNVK